MDNNKKAAFVRAHKRQKLSKGGLIRKLGNLHYFDAGGTVNTQPSASTSGPTSGGMYDAWNPKGLGVAGNNPVTNAYGTAFQGATNMVGSGAQGIAQALTTQNGYQANLAPTDYTNYQQFINPAGAQSLSGFQNANQLQSQQQGLANQLQAQTLGQGPNPAQAELAQNTQANVANQAALMAGQRGSSANAGLMARQAAQTGAGIQQGAVGQEATLRAQQTLGAQQALGAQQQNMVQGNLGEQGANNALFGASSGAQNAQNANTIQNWNNMQSINADTAKSNAAAVNSTEQGMVGGGATKIMSMIYKGGEVEPAKEAEGGEIHHDQFHEHFKNYFSEGGSVPAMVSPGEVYLSPEKVRQVVHEGANPMKIGEHIGGKASKKNDSLKNDTVPKTLEEGGVVIPRHITTHKMNAEKAELFVHRAIAKRKVRG